MPNFIDRTGETGYSNAGVKMTIIACRGYHDIDIQFEDGTIRKHKSYRNFKQHTIQHPTIKPKSPKQKIDYVGHTGIAKNGMKMTIIAYRTSKDLDIQFEDGTILYHKHLSAFNKGYIKHPHLGDAKRKDYTGETNIATNKMRMTIIASRSNRDIDILFENGMLIQNKAYNAFKRGNIASLSVINDINLIKFAYIFRNQWYYICKHPDWTERRILSVQEMYDYCKQST